MRRSMPSRPRPMPVPTIDAAFGRGARRIARPAAACALAAILGACAQTGDFGRPAPGAWNGLVAATGTRAADARDEPASAFPLTDDERTLRARAWRLLMPARVGEVLDDALANLVRARVLPASWHPGAVAAYHDGLAAEEARSPVSRYRRLAEDATADARLVAPFAALAARVNEADGLRLRNLPFARTLDDDAVRDAAMRVAENRCLIARVRLELGARTAGYRYALEHLVVAVPGPEAVGAERAVALLDARRALLDTLLPPEAAARCGLVAGAERGADFAPARAAVTKD